MSRGQAVDAGPEWIRKEWEDIFSWWEVRKKDLGWRMPLKTLKRDRSFSPGQAFPRNEGRWLCYGLRKQAEHECGAHQS